MDFDLFDRSVLDPDGPRALDGVERSLWLDLWRAPVLDAVEEQGVEARNYGPIQATVVAGLPEAALLNLLLGAAEPGAVGEGHLAQALEWVDTHEIQCRVPVDARRPEAGAAEEVLSHWGYRRAESQVRLLRASSPPDLPAPAGIEVRELASFTEGFGDLLSEGYELGPYAGWLFDCLPERSSWHCYLALDEDGGGRAVATTMDHYDTIHVGFAATEESVQGRGLHLALLHRIVADAAERGTSLLAETTEPLGERDGPSPGCRNLLRSGFHQVAVRPVWRRQG